MEFKIEAASHLRRKFLGAIMPSMIEQLGLLNSKKAVLVIVEDNKTSPNMGCTVNIDELEAVLKQKLGDKPDTYISLHVDKTVPFENAVKVMNIAQTNNYKLIIATSPK